MTAHTQNCASCGSEIHGELYHLGFSDMECMYCDSCPRVLLLKDPGFYERNGIVWPNLQPGDKGWEYYNAHLLPIYNKLESLFAPCACGGKFRACALLRCPKCNKYLLGGEVHEDKPIYWNPGHVFVTIGFVTEVEQIRNNAA